MSADNIPKCLSVLKPDGHLSHIQNLGSDKDRIQAMAQAHSEGKSQQNAFHVLVAPNGPQLEEVFGLIAACKVKLEVAKVGKQASDRVWGLTSLYSTAAIGWNLVMACSRYCFLRFSQGSCSRWVWAFLQCSQQRCCKCCSVRTTHWFERGAGWYCCSDVV